MKARPTIAQHNDLLRTSFLTGRVMLTEGISSLPPEVLEEVLTKVAPTVASPTTTTPMASTTSAPLTRKARAVCSGPCGC